MIIIRETGARSVVVIIEGRERCRFTHGTKKQNLADAIAWLENRATKPPSRQRTLFATVMGAQAVHHITDAGDNTEPKELCDASLLMLTDDKDRETQLVLTARELDSLAAEWVLARSKQVGVELARELDSLAAEWVLARSKQVGVELSDFVDRHAKGKVKL
jgi:elongation factor P hydroxylase